MTNLTIFFDPAARGGWRLNISDGVLAATVKLRAATDLKSAKSEARRVLGYTAKWSTPTTNPLNGTEVVKATANRPGLAATAWKAA